MQNRSVSDFVIGNASAAFWYVFQCLVLSFQHRSKRGLGLMRADCAPLK